MGEVLRNMKERAIDIAGVPITPAALAGLIAIVEKGTISSTVAKDVFATMYETGRAAADIVAADGLAQISDTSSLEPIVRTHRRRRIPTSLRRSGPARIASSSSSSAR